MVLMIAICVTAIVITAMICWTHRNCVQFKYQTVQPTVVTQADVDLQAALDEKHEKDKPPTMDEMIRLAQEIIGGDDDNE